MDLKEIFGEALSGQIQTALDQYNSKADKKVKLVDLSDGGYVSKEKHQDKLSALQSQIEDYKTQLDQRNKDLQSLQDQLKAAGPEKLNEVCQNLASLQAKYDQDSKAWEAKMSQQAYEFLVKEKASELQFSSVAARKEFIREAVEKSFKVDGDTLQGYGDWLKAYQEADPGAFKTESAAESKKPEIIQPSNPSSAGGQRMTLSEMMAQANANPSFVPKFD